MVAQAAVEIGAVGSKRSRAQTVAARVARLSVKDVLSGADDLSAKFQMASAELEIPTVVALARNPQIDTAAIVFDEAVKQFETRGCRNLQPSEWEKSECELVEAVASRLIERYRKAL